MEHPHTSPSPLGVQGETHTHAHVDSKTSRLHHPQEEYQCRLGSGGILLDADGHLPPTRTGTVRRTEQETHRGV